MADTHSRKDPMTIGAFSRRTRLSTKALRLYDAMGLLPPAFVDDDNGYRHYTEAQVEPARLIALLRRLEMPLEDIARILALQGPEAARAVTAYWRAVESDVRTKRRLVRYLEDRLGGKGDAMFEIQTRHVPEQKVVTIQGNVVADGLPDFIATTMDELLRHLAEAGRTPSAAPFVTYHGEVDADSDGPVETCIPFTGDLDPTGGLRIRMEPAHEEAYTRITKAQVAFPSILEAYDAVSRHLREQGKKAGAPREVYFADWGSAGDDEPVCDVAFPYTS